MARDAGSMSQESRTSDSAARAGGQSDGPVDRSGRWLEDHLQADRDRMDSIERDIRRVADVVREHGAVLARINQNTDQAEAADLRLSQLTDAVRNLREHVSLIERALETHFAATEQSERARSIEFERDRRGMTELATTIDDMRRLIEQNQVRVAALAEETRRDRTATASVTPRFDEIERVQGSFQGRLAQFEELTRRYAQQTSTFDEQADRARNDIARLDNAQKLTDIRWTREFEEVLRRVEAYQARVDEQLKPIGAVAKESAALGDQLKEAVERLAGFDQEIAKATSALVKIELRVGNIHDQATRLEQRQDDLRRRQDEIDAQVRRIADEQALLRVAIEDDQHKIEKHGNTIAEFAGWVERIDAARERIDDVNGEIQTELRRQARAIEDVAENVAQQIELLTGSVNQDLEAAWRVSVEHQRRLIAELTRQATELEERIRPARPESPRP